MPNAIKRKALDAPHSPYALLENVGYMEISSGCENVIRGAYPRIVGENRERVKQI